MKDCLVSTQGAVDMTLLCRTCLYSEPSLPVQVVEGLVTEWPVLTDSSQLALSVEVSAQG